MSILKKTAGVAVAALAVLGIAAGPASASDTIKADGTALDVGDRIHGITPAAGNSGSALLESSIGNIDCQSEFLSTVVENPGNGSAGFAQNGDHRAEIQVDPSNSSRSPRDFLTFDGCTDTLPIVDVQSAEIVGGVVGLADGTPDTDPKEPETVTLQGITVRVDLTFFQQCTFQGDVVGVLDEQTQTLTFSDAGVQRISGSSSCPDTGQFSAVYSLTGYDAADTTLSNPLGSLSLEP